MNKKIKEIVYKLISYFCFYHEKTDYWWSFRIKSLSCGYTAFITKILYRRLINRYNGFIPLSVEFTNKPILPHGIRGIFISNGAKIGANSVIFRQVTIGSNNLSDAKRKGAPIIGDNVYIGCGAKIIGNIRIGDNVRIGANCVVCEDFPDNSTVVLPKSRIIIKNNNQNNIFIAYK